MNCTLQRYASYEDCKRCPSSWENLLNCEQIWKQNIVFKWRVVGWNSRSCRHTLCRLSYWAKYEHASFLPNWSPLVHDLRTSSAASHHIWHANILQDHCLIAAAATECATNTARTLQKASLYSGEENLFQSRKYLSRIISIGNIPQSQVFWIGYFAFHSWWWFRWYTYTRIIDSEKRLSVRLCWRPPSLETCLKYTAVECIPLAGHVFRWSRHCWLNESDSFSLTNTSSVWLPLSTFWRSKTVLYETTVKDWISMSRAAPWPKSVREVEYDWACLMTLPLRRPGLPIAHWNWQLCRHTVCKHSLFPKLNTSKTKFKTTAIVFDLSRTRTCNHVH